MPKNHQRRRLIVGSEASSGFLRLTRSSGWIVSRTTTASQTYLRVLSSIVEIQEPKKHGPGKVEEGDKLPFAGFDTNSGTLVPFYSDSRCCGVLRNQDWTPIADDTISSAYTLDTLRLDTYNRQGAWRAHPHRAVCRLLSTSHLRLLSQACSST